jgi:hypothetical protein
MSRKSTNLRHRLRYQSVKTICVCWQKRMKKLARESSKRLVHREAPVNDIL